ncbi:MAG: DNA polymerase III subunit beta [Alistipes sp.]|jgi:DNA polymerase-3 subunit beta|nr:DNA polymerase III subunit beta [Alistipes sp.]MBQ6584051.1 DNA polymerase III subunit beta [Alistipes sp.]MBR2116445.1 DNA polymerase III subunit beta [Alistipes sp.]MEE0915981.1 DNA polymerase III subunit beta [Alistipes sp.]
MKFTVSSSALLSILSITGKVINNKSSLPILEHFLMELKDGVLRVTASDSETTLIGTLEVENVEREGMVAAPAKVLLDVLKECSEMPLTFDVNDNTWEIKITWHSGGSSVPGANPVSYPTNKTLAEDKTEITLDVDTLVNGINKTIFATADDDFKPMMNGVFFNIEQSGITYVATDGHKLVKFTTEHENNSAASFILPKKPANLLKALLLKEEDDVTVSFDKSNAVFTLKNYILICRLIEGDYPNYNAVIPTANPNKILIDRIEFLNGIKRVAVCANSATNLIRLDVADNKLTLTAQDVNFYVSANESLNCSYEGSPISIGFKSIFLVEILANIETPTVLVELADSTRAGVFKPVYDDVQSTSTLMLLMPMIISA